MLKFTVADMYEKKYTGKVSRYEKEAAKKVKRMQAEREAQRKVPANAGVAMNPQE